MLPRPVVAAPARLPDEEPDPEAELRARLLLYRAHRDAGPAARRTARRVRIGLFRREPSRPRAAALGGRAAAGRAAARSRLARPARSTGWRGSRRRRSRRPRSMPRTITLDRAGRDHPGGAPRRADRRPPGPARAASATGSSIAVTFLAMLELMKRREIVVDAGRAVGPDRGPGDDAPRSGRAAASPTDADDAPLDEILESFA